MHSNLKETIIACSTGNQHCAISLIRISGHDYLSTINSFFSINTEKLKPNYSHFTKILDSHKVLDECLITYFKSPHSYNGEDIVEISVHGNPVNVSRIIKLFISKTNFRMADPGEFSLRAVKNKKLSLSQVEGLDLLLNSKSIFALDQGLSVLSGDIKQSFQDLYDNFLNHRSSLELGFDFLEDVGEELYRKNLNSSFEKLSETIDYLYQRSINLGFNFINPEIVLVGEPNAGKSTIFNSLLNMDRSIVSDIKGTTRDFVSESIVLSNNLFKLIDTAGIRLSNDVIESEGIKRSLMLFKEAFYKVLVVNPFDSFDYSFDPELSSSIDLLIFTHADLAGFSKAKKNWITANLHTFAPIEPKSTGPIEPKSTGLIEPKSTGPIEPKSAGPIEPKSAGPIEPKSAGPIEPKSAGPIEPKCNSSKYLNILDFFYSSDELSRTNFLEEISSLVSSKYIEVQNFDPILIERHKSSILEIHQAFEDYKDVFKLESDASILSSELNIVGHCISELIGIVSPDNVLHNIFDNFCIGK